MESVQIGVMLPGAQQFKDANVNPVWKAHVKTQSGICVAYVKKVKPRALYVESVCAVLGRYVGIPIPKPIIVQITHDCFSDIPANNYELGFGSEDAGYPSFRRYANDQAAVDKLKCFSKTFDVGVFDEWVANWDRNIGNILYDGNDDFSFIDHENAIPRELKAEEPSVGNEIIKVFYSILSEFEKYKLCRELKTNFSPKYEEIPYSLLIEKTYASSYLSANEIQEVIKFLELRVNHLNVLFEKRLELKQQRLDI